MGNDHGGVDRGLAQLAGVALTGYAIYKGAKYIEANQHKIDPRWGGLLMLIVWAYMPVGVGSAIGVGFAYEVLTEQNPSPQLVVLCVALGLVCGIGTLTFILSLLTRAGRRLALAVIIPVFSIWMIGGLFDGQPFKKSCYVETVSEDVQDGYKWEPNGTYSFGVEQESRVPNIITRTYDVEHCSLMGMPGEFAVEFSDSPYQIPLLAGLILSFFYGIWGAFHVPAVLREWFKPPAPKAIEEPRAEQSPETIRADRMSPPPKHRYAAPPFGGRG